MSIEIKTTTVVDLTPEQLAQAWWALGDREQARFYAELGKLPQSDLEAQAFHIATSIASLHAKGDTSAVTAYRTLHGVSDYYLETFAWRATSDAKREIDRMCETTP